MDSSNILADIAHPLENRIDPMLHRVQERVRELELELAQTKLAHVEAECRNQVSDLSISEYSMSRPRESSNTKSTGSDTSVARYSF